MSFRYTNNLIGLMKHRVLLERARRVMSERTFTGRCNGITVSCNANSMVQSIEISPEAEAAGTFVNAHDNNSVNTELLASSIRTAAAVANQDIRRAKEEGYRSSITGIEELKTKYNLWFEEDAGSLRPRPYEALVDEVGATPLIKHIRRDTTSSPLSVADIHKTLTPGLLTLEDSRRVISEQRREMAEQERDFWHRVELIRKGQSATIVGAKRSYKDEGLVGQTLKDSSHEKVSLKFVQ
jgi:hypothetical protein